ncbi:hypothetical protein [Gelatiniphilus marinus]|uniref:DUF2764 family protein n=1 Tax=Gelatiniphilus marinus TaxID=1759464 RepID=A0ABW5JSF5_9FLAO
MLAGNLEYVMASLPNLTFSNSEAIQHEVTSLFKKYALLTDAPTHLVDLLHEEAEKYLSEKQCRDFKQIQLNAIHQSCFQNHKNKVVSEFSIFINQLKQELKTFRIARKSDEAIGKNSYKLIGDLPNNPLDAELQLLKLQWQKLDMLSVGHYANISALILYKLKLQVLLRWWSFNESVGFEAFQQTLKTEVYGR